MELYLDSADVREIDAAFQWGILKGLTTTPTFMHREGITDVDAAILALAPKVPVLQIEALGQTAESIVAEAYRQEALGLDRKTTVYKIPVSLEGVKACKQLTNEGFLVNVHLVYTVLQAYMALNAGATYVCPLVGRLQDQGTDALSLVADCVEVVERYGYDSKIMFSSVRYPEHVRNALQVGAHAVTVPYKILTQLTQNHFTELGTKQFEEHTRLVSVRVSEVMQTPPPTVRAAGKVSDALLPMNLSGLGAVVLINEDGSPTGMFTDGDLRRLMERSGAEGLNASLSNWAQNTPHSIPASALLRDAADLFKSAQVDQLVVLDQGQAVGLVDVQHVLG